MKLRKGDKVKILIGKDKGKEGNIERIFPTDNRVLILGINEFKRHIKARVKGQKSEITTITKPLTASNVALVCPNCKKPTRVGFRIDKGKKVRVCRKCDKLIN